MFRHYPRLPIPTPAPDHRFPPLHQLRPCRRPICLQLQAAAGFLICWFCNNRIALMACWLVEFCSLFLVWRNCSADRSAGWLQRQRFQGVNTDLAHHARCICAPGDGQGQSPQPGRDHRGGGHTTARGYAHGSGSGAAGEGSRCSRQPGSHEYGEPGRDHKDRSGRSLVQFDQGRIERDQGAKSETIAELALDEATPPQSMIFR